MANNKVLLETLKAAAKKDADVDSEIVAALQKIAKLQARVTKASALIKGKATDFRDACQ